MNKLHATDQVDVTVLGGAGHVGLPLALMLAHSGLQVRIHDRNRQVMEQIRQGRLPYIEYDAQPYLDQALAENRLSFSSEMEEFPLNGPIIITIGTPVDEHLNPVHKVVVQCFEDLQPYLSPDRLLILRSTIYPGTTEWLDRHLREKNAPLKIAFCPERVTQGYAVRELLGIPQIVSGTSAEAVEEAAALFGRFAPSIIRSTPREAEFAKLFTNAYRYITFAAVNQFYMIADSAGLDFYRIHDIMTRDYDRLRGFPRAGFTAGPCLFKDTMQLSAYTHNQFSLGHNAMLINEGLVLYLVDNLRARMGELSGKSVGLLGMAFKPEVDDTRTSLSYKMKKILKVHAKAVMTTDPYVTDDPELLPLEQVIEASDFLVLCVPHKRYRSVDFQGKTVVDINGFL